jgi:hypothetical protein
MGRIKDESINTARKPGPHLALASFLFFFHLSRQVALQSRHEVRPLPKRLDLGKPRHEIKCNVSFRNVRWVEEMREFSGQLRIITLKNSITRATAAEKDAISTISIPSCTVAYTTDCALTSSSSLLQ